MTKSLTSVVSITPSPAADVKASRTPIITKTRDWLYASKNKLNDPEINRINIVLFLPNSSDKIPNIGPKRKLLRSLNISKNPVKDAIPTFLLSKDIPSRPKDSAKYNERVETMILPRNNLVNMVPIPILKTFESPKKILKPYCVLSSFSLKKELSFFIVNANGMPRAVPKAKKMLADLKPHESSKIPPIRAPNREPVLETD
jgi:hypothetical protein